MTALTVRLPDDKYRRLKEVAHQRQPSDRRNGHFDARRAGC